VRPKGTPAADICYAGFDAERTGHDIAQRLLKERRKHVGLFTGSLNQPDAALFIKGFDAVWKGKRKLVECSDYQMELRVFDFFDDDAVYDCIVCADRQRQDILKAAYAYASHDQLPRLMVITSRAALIDPADMVYELDYKLLAHRIVKAVVGRLDGGMDLPAAIQLPTNGFRVIETSAEIHNATLRMLTIASPSTTALTHLLPYLEKTTGIRLELTVVPSLRDLYDVLQTDTKSRFDLIRMDVAWMDELAGQLFRPLADMPFDWKRLQGLVIPELGEHYTRSHGIDYCLPYDPSTQLMFYRRDLFGDPTVKRQYYETYRSELEVPTSFTDYNHVAGFFTRALNLSSPTVYGTTIAIGNVVVSPSEFLVRLYEAGGSLLDKRGNITIDTPQAMQALSSYQQMYRYSDMSIYDIWENALVGFADGSAAMTVVFINYASDILNSKMSSIAGKLGYAPVPGGRPLLGGGVVGVTKDCTDPDTAYRFMSWLYSDQVAPVFTMLGGLSPCSCAYNNRDINERYPWLSTARRSFPMAQKRQGSQRYDNFSELKLEKIIADNVQQAVLGKTTAQQALRNAQAQCDGYFMRRRLKIG